MLKAVGWETSEVIADEVLGGDRHLAGRLPGRRARGLPARVRFLGPLFEPVLKGWSVLYPPFDLVPHIDPYQLLALFFLTVVPYTVATVIPSWSAATVDPDLVMRQ